MKLKIGFRADASLQIGTGHVMRCLTLASALREQGAECHFLCREHPGNLIEVIEARGFRVHRLASISQPDEPSLEPAIESPQGQLHVSEPPHAHWLSVTWEQDAEACKSLLADLAPDWLVVDHYALEARWEAAVLPENTRLLVIDDLADRAHKADLLLDQNALSNKTEERYRARVNPECKLLMGPRYALLGQEYSFLSTALPERDGQVFRALIFVGGSDPYHLTEQYLRALSTPEFGYIQLDVVIGRNHPAPEAVAEMVSQRQGTRLYSGLPSLAALMVRADLMLGAGGATNWERMCLGLISIVVSVAQNQNKACCELAERNLMNFVGPVEKVSIKNIRLMLREVLSNPSINRKQAGTMRDIVDGHGAERVAKCFTRGVL